MVSSGLILITLVSLLFKGLNLGLDFTGGISLEMKYEQKADLRELEIVSPKLRILILLS